MFKYFKVNPLKIYEKGIQYIKSIVRKIAITFF